MTAQPPPEALALCLARLGLLVARPSRLHSSQEAVAEGAEVEVPVVLEHFGDEVDLLGGRVEAPDDLTRGIQLHYETVLGRHLVQDPAVVDLKRWGGGEEWST